MICLNINPKTTCTCQLQSHCYPDGVRQAYGIADAFLRDMRAWIKAEYPLFTEKNPTKNDI